jgi:hypothetical protein
MTMPAPSNQTNTIINSTPEYSGVEFATTADGIPVARIGDTVLAMIPGRHGSPTLASTWRVDCPLVDLTRGDFYVCGSELTDEAGFRLRVMEIAEHKRDLIRLARREIRSACNTPWGASQYAETYVDGIVRYGTSRHGGFRLSSDCNGKVYPKLRKGNGWYEEDCEWAIVALTFPDLFTGYERKCADQTLRDWWPNEWEIIHGRKLAPGESHCKDREAFKRQHAGDWVVISALRSDHHPGMTEVIATCGGSRDPHCEERRFLVTSAEYEMGRFGFVIDETRHVAYDGPSSFASWRGG